VEAGRGTLVAGGGFNDRLARRWGVWVGVDIFFFFLTLPPIPVLAVTVVMGAVATMVLLLLFVEVTVLILLLLLLLLLLLPCILIILLIILLLEGVDLCFLLPMRVLITMGWFVIIIGDGVLGCGVVDMVAIGVALLDDGDGLLLFGTFLSFLKEVEVVGGVIVVVVITVAFAFTVGVAITFDITFDVDVNVDIGVALVVIIIILANGVVMVAAFFVLEEEGGIRMGVSFEYGTMVGIKIALVFVLSDAIAAVTVSVPVTLAFTLAVALAFVGTAIIGTGSVLFVIVLDE